MFSHFPDGKYYNFFCITSLPLAFTRWVQSTFSSHCPLSSKQRHWLTSAKVTIFSIEKYQESQELNLWQLGPEASILTIVLRCQLSQHHCHHSSQTLLFCFKVMLMRKFTSCCLSLRWKKRHQFDPSLTSDALWGPRREFFPHLSEFVKGTQKLPGESLSLSWNKWTFNDVKVFWRSQIRIDRQTCKPVTIF